MTETQLAAAVTSYAHPDLEFDEPTHTYRLRGREQISVTTALRLAGLTDTSWCQPEAAARGTRVHAAIELFHQGKRFTHDAECGPYMQAYEAFLSTGDFAVDANEERLCDPALMCAGTLDLRGRFLGDSGGFLDVIDVKSGEVPPWVGYQTAGYVRLLPPMVSRRCRRWCLQLQPTGTFRLIPLLQRSDFDVFLAALVIARAKQGWR